MSVRVNQHKGGRAAHQLWKRKPYGSIPPTLHHMLTQSNSRKELERVVLVWYFCSVGRATAFLHSSASNWSSDLHESLPSETVNCQSLRSTNVLTGMLRWVFYLLIYHLLARTAFCIKCVYIWLPLNQMKEYYFQTHIKKPNLYFCQDKVRLQYCLFTERWMVFTAGVSVWASFFH